MSICKVFIDHSLSLWRKCKLLDIKSFLLACLIFIGGCVLAMMSWKLGLPWIFLLPYVILGTSGCFIYYLNGLTVIQKNVSEASLPLLSPVRLNAPAHHQHKNEHKASKNENCQNVDKECSENCGSERNIYTDNVSVQNEFSPSSVPKNVTDSAESVVKCVQPNSSPRVVHEIYATGPSPGGSQSRKSRADAGGSSRRRRLSPLAGLFRTPRRGPSSQFHVRLTEISRSRSEPGIVDVANPTASVGAHGGGAQAAVQWMSANPREPIYENIIPYPPRRRTHSEGYPLEQLGYDIPQEELANVERRAEMSCSTKQSALETLPAGNEMTEEKRGNISGQSRVGDFTSPERTYFNVFSPQRQKGYSSPSETTGFSERTKNTIPEWGSASNSESIYVNIPPKGMIAEQIGDQESARESMQSGSISENIYVNFPPKGMKAEQICDQDSARESMQSGSIAENIYANIPPKDRGVEQTEMHQENASGLSSSNTRNVKSEIFPYSPLQNENIYANISHMRCKTNNDNLLAADLGNDAVTKSERLSPSTESGTPSKHQKREYINKPLSCERSSVLTTKASPTETLEVESSESSGYSVDAEIEISVAKIEISASNECEGENETPIHSGVERKDTKGKSDYIYVTHIGPTLKRYVKPGTSAVRTELPPGLENRASALDASPSAEKPKTSNEGYTGDPLHKNEPVVAKGSELKTTSDYVPPTDIIPLELISQKKLTIRPKYPSPFFLEGINCLSKACLPDACVHKTCSPNDILPQRQTEIERKPKSALLTSRLLKTRSITQTQSSEEKPQERTVSQQDGVSGHLLNISDEKRESVKNPIFGHLDTFRLSTEQQRIPALIPVKDATSSEQVSARTTSDEDPHCLQKSVTEGETPQVRNSQLRKSLIKSNTPQVSIDEAIASQLGIEKPKQLRTHEKVAQKSTCPEYIFSPRNLRSSSQQRTVSSESTDERSSGRVPFSKSLNIPSVKLSRPLERGSVKNISKSSLPGRKVPGMSNTPRSYSSSGLAASSGNSTPPVKIDLPVIVNRNTLVQSQLQKIPASNRPMQLSSASSLRSSERSSISSSGVLPRTKSEAGSSRSSIISEGNLPTKSLGQSSDASITPLQPTTETETDEVFVSDIATHSSAVSPPKESDGNSSPKRYSPVYF